MSALPKAVQRQIAAANKVADTYYKQLAEGGTPPAEPPVDGAEPPPAGAEPPAPVVAEPSAAPAPLPQEGFEQKYKVLQGKYNAEVPRMQETIRGLSENVRRLNEQLSATQSLLASLDSRQGAAPAEGSPPRTPAQSVKLVKDEEVKEFGADLIDVSRRVAREEIASAVEAEVSRRMQPVTQRVEQVAQATGRTQQRVAQSDKQAVFDMLDRDVPNWAKVNKDQEFLDWLDQVDPYNNVRRGVLLGQAFESYDGPRVVAFFNGFLKEHAAVASSTTPAAPAPAAAAPQVSLDKLVTPGLPKTGAAGTQDGSGKRVWTRAEIGKFFADKAAGRYNSTAGKAKADAMEADIFAAQAEGRVR